MKCRKGYNIIVCQSAAGYYLGTKDETGAPNCRLTDYAGTKDQAENLEMTRQFHCVENEYCHKGYGCLIPD